MDNIFQQEFTLHSWDFTLKELDQGGKDIKLNRGEFIKMETLFCEIEFNT